MSKKTVRIETENFSRVLLTETLPYEVPLIFSNDGFCQQFEIIKNGELPDIVTKTIEKKGVTIPFCFKIAKSQSGNRTLSVPHPAVQLELVSLYKKYAHVILTLCTKSPCSLRYPAKIGRYFYEPGFASLERTQEHLVEEDNNITQQEHATSFFAYKKYNLLYKFYDSYEYHRLEKRFLLLRTADVSRCFENIYTHSIAWAVKSKDHAKQNIGAYSFENEFDRIMRNANYGETAGIIVGPEFSRIFAEIILQKVDLDVITDLKTMGLNEGVDYVAKRYVDDYFIFCNSYRHEKIISDTYGKHLENYKLFLNDKKSFITERPFVTEISIAKNDLKSFCSNFIQSLHTMHLDSLDKKVIKKNPNRFSNSLIYEFKTIIKKRNATFSSISGLVFDAIGRGFKQGLSDYSKRFKQDVVTKELVQNFENYVFVNLDFLFFVYAMHPATNATNKLSRILLAIVKLQEELHSEKLRFSFELLFKKICDEATFMLTKPTEQHSSFQVEKLNLLITLKSLGENFLLEEKQLRKIAGNSESDLNYFQLITLLYYIEDISQYDELRIELLKSASEKISSSDNPQKEAELTFLLFDLISCPYTTDEYCKDLLVNWNEKVTKKRGYQTAQKDMNFIKSKQWFTCWDKEVDLTSLLRKKQIKPPY